MKDEMRARLVAPKMKVMAAVVVAGLLAVLALAGCGGGSSSGSSSGGGGDEANSPIGAVEQIVGYYKTLDGMEAECSPVEYEVSEEEGGQCADIHPHTVNPEAPVCKLVSNTAYCVMWPSVAKKLNNCQFKETGTGGSDGSFGQRNPSPAFAGTEGVYAKKTAGVEVRCGAAHNEVYMGEVEGRWMIAELNELYL